MQTWVAILIGASIALAALVRSLWKDSQARRKEREVAIEKRARWEGEVDTDRTYVKESLDRLQVAADRILRRLVRLTGEEGNTVAGRSRLSLTSLWETASDKIRAKDWANELVPTLAAQVEGKVPYEIQEVCMNLVRSPRFSPPAERRGLVLEVAFDHGLHEADVLEVLAIELRDALLALQKAESDENE